MAFTKIAAAGIGSTETVTLHSLEVLNNATVGGVLTYEDVTNVDSIGIITARAGVLVGSGITLSKDGDGFFTGIVTASSFGAVSGTTGTFTGDVDIADKIIHTGDTNTAIRFPAADTITAETGGSERVRIASDGDMGVGTDSPSVRLHVSGGDGLLVERSSGTSIAGFKHSGASAMNIYFQNTGSTNHPSIGSANQDMTFGTNNNERVRITSAGSVGIGTEIVSGAKLDVIDGIINVGAAVTTADARIQFTRKASGIYSWIGIPTWNPNALYIYGPKDSDPYNEAAALYESSTWQFLTGGTARVQINPTGSLNIRNTSGYNTYDVDISNAATTDTSVQIRPNDGNAGEAQLYIGGGGTNQNKCAIIFDPAGGYCRGNLHICMENTADTSNVDSTDKKLSISPEGYVTKSSQPAFLVLPANNAETADGDVTYTSVNHNTGGHYSTSTGKFTAPVAGYYSFFANYTGDAGSTSCQVKFKINGVINAVGNHYSGGSPTSWNTNPYMSCDLSGTHVYLSANDYVQLNLVSNGASQGQAAYMRFFGYMLH